MDQDQAKEPIRIYLDEADEPFKEEQPPLRFNFSTIQLPDGPHTLRVEASNGLAPPSIKRIPFTVRNGVALSISGLEEGQTISGQIEMIVNAFAGNTEVDFEPRQAETPTPVPTWAWVLLLAVFAWTLFYVLNPADASQLRVKEAELPEAEVGDRIYTDTCARCHGETGDGREAADGSRSAIPRLRDTRTYALAGSPLNLLIKVVQGTDGTMMPGWGPILDNEEIVAVVNHVRTSWHHDASVIQLNHRRPPVAIERLEKELDEALTKKDADALAQCCWPRGGRRPLLYRTDGVRARGRERVKEAWESYFLALGEAGQVTAFELTEERYDYEKATVDQNGAIVIGMGRIFLQAETQSGRRVEENGRFIRVYQLWEGSWALVFDFADIPMNVGCNVGEDEYCPPVEGAELPGLPPIEPDSGPAAVADAIGFEDIQRMFRALGRGAGDAPHEDFWNWDYERFCTESFPESWDDVTKLDNLVRIVEPGNVERSNLIRAFEGRGILVVLPDKSEVEHAVERMPKNGPFLPADVIAQLRAWVEAGCPKVAGGPPHASAKGAGGGDEPPPAPPIADAGNKPPPQPATKGVGIGYAELVAMIEATGRGAGDAPHEDFWKKSWDEFVRFSFEESWNDPDQLDNKIRLVVPGHPDRSNLLRAFEGRPLITTLPDGTEEEHDKPQMPKNGPFLAPGQIAQIRAWILAGCPEVAGGAPHPTMTEGSAGGSEPPPTPPPAPEPASEPAPVPAPAPVPEAPPATPAVASVGFEDVKTYLRDLGRSPTTIPHGSFWDELGYEAFVAFKFPREWGEEFEYRLLIPYDAANSNLVKVLKDGKGVTRESSAGEQIVEDVPRMPTNAKPMPKERLDKLIEWINAGCPKEAGKPSSIPRPKASGN